MSNIFITGISGSGIYAVPEDSAALQAAEAGLQALLSGVMGLSFDKAYSWVKTTDGSGASRTLNCLLVNAQYMGVMCPSSAQIAAMTAAIQTQLLGDPNIVSVSVQDVNLVIDSGGSGIWLRNSATGRVELVDPGDFVSLGGIGDPSSLFVGEGSSEEPSAPTSYLYEYDNSAPSGSRFTQIDPSGGFPWTQPTDNGDALYVGVDSKHYAWIFDVATAKDSTPVAVEIWNGSSWDSFDKATYPQGVDTNRGPSFWENVESQVVQVDKYVEQSSWAQADDVLDEIPNTGASLYWVRFRNTAVVGVSAVINSINLRGSGFEYNGVAEAMRLWGTARKRVRERFFLANMALGEPPWVNFSDISAVSSSMPNPGSTSRRIHVFGTSQPSNLNAQWKGYAVHQSGAWTWVDGNAGHRRWMVLCFIAGSGPGAWHINAGDSLTLTVDGNPFTVYLPELEIVEGQEVYLYVDQNGSTYNAAGIYAPDFFSLAYQAPSGYSPARRGLGPAAGVPDGELQSGGMSYENDHRMGVSFTYVLPPALDNGSKLRIFLGLAPGGTGNYDWHVDAKALSLGDQVGAIFPPDISFDTIITYTPAEAGRVQSTLLSTDYSRMISVEGVDDRGGVVIRLARDATTANPNDTGGDIVIVEFGVEYVVQDLGRAS